MQKINPYKTLKGALSALDNGGRFYNFLTGADDGQIEPAELAKVAGVFTDRKKMFLYLDMALAYLNSNEAERVISTMTPELQSEYRCHKPSHYTPAEANKYGRAATSATITGIPHYVQSNSDFSGFIMIPISTGKTTTFTMVPIIDHYDVYEVRDMETKDDFLVAHARGRQKLPNNPATLGGILKELKGDKKCRPKHNLFLESLYYSTALL